MYGGIDIPRDDCEWRAGGLGNMANRCDGDQVAVGACGSGFNNDCPGELSQIIKNYSIEIIQLSQKLKLSLPE